MEDEKTEVAADLLENVRLVMEILAGAKVGQSGSLPCPKCKIGTVHWTLPGPRAFRLLCTTEHCLTAMS